MEFQYLQGTFLCNYSNTCSNKKLVSLNLLIVVKDLSNLSFFHCIVVPVQTTSMESSTAKGNLYSIQSCISYVLKAKKEEKEEEEEEINTVSYCYATDLSTRSAKRLWLSMGLYMYICPHFMIPIPLLEGLLALTFCKVSVDSNNNK